jgi:aspartate-semialdehyde dehydrogenase
MNKINIAIVGATGNVGRKIVEILEEREFPANELYLVASSKSLGKKISFKDSAITVQNLDSFDFSKVNVVFSCVSSSITKKYIDKAISSGCVIIDKSSLFRMDEDVPLIVPEVNEHLISDVPNRKIISSPNCVVIPLAVALSPLDSVYKIKRVIVSTYQSVSGAGKDHMDELFDQTKSCFMPNTLPSKKFERQIAFNIIPKIDSFSESGDTLEEEKICQELKKIIGSHIQVTATCVRVPVFVGHSISCNVEFENDVTAFEAEEILSEAEGVNLISTDGDMKYITPKEIAGEDMVFVSRVRKDKSNPNSLNMWIVSDNLRKGAATNAVQILESLRLI